MSEPHAGDLVSAHLDGELDPETAGWVEQHLAGCEPCRAAADDVRSAREWLRSLPPVDGATVIAGFLSRHRAAIRTGTAFVGAAAVALGAIALSSAALRPEVVPHVDALARVHAHVTTAASSGPHMSEQSLVAAGLDDDVVAMRPVQRVAALYAAPAAVLGNRSRLSRQALYDGDDMTVVVYGDGRSSVTVFEQPGTLDWDGLPAGAIEQVRDRRVWVRDGTLTVMVTVAGDLVVTAVSDDRAAATTVIDGLPHNERDTTWDRLHDACARFTRTFAGG